MNDRKEVEERPYFKKLILAGKRLGIDVFVFTPEDVDHSAKRIAAQCYDPQQARWSRRLTGFPLVIYDRCRQLRSKRFVQLKQFRSKYPDLLYMNRPLTNKWKMHLIYLKHPEIRKHVPYTQIYTKPDDLKQALKKYPLLYLKPIHGTGGRGILRLQQTEGGRISVQGRNERRTIIRPFHASPDTIADKLRGWHMADRYIIQQGLDLRLQNGRVHDYRLLIQKNGAGKWEITGCAGRVGPHMSITSNLHGGGQAMPMERLLKLGRFPAARIGELRTEANGLAHAVAKHIEQHFGSLCELALDLGIDRDGRIWLLEINQKPSREVFHRIGEKSAYHKAVARPLEYALWLCRKKNGAD